MKDFGSVLCNETKDGVYVNTLATLEDDRLFITGEDSGKIQERYPENILTYAEYILMGEYQEKLIKVIQ